MSPGYKTTEFWLTLLTTLMSALVATGLIGPDTQAAKVAATVTMVLASIGYTASRATVKKAHAPTITNTATSLVQTTISKDGAQ
jgi:hypothetical protein